MLKIFKSSLALGILSGLLNIMPVQAAEKLLLTYGPLKLTLPVSSLENFAKDGSIDESLALYLKNLTPAEQTEFRELLTKKIPLDPVMASRFLNTVMGEEILTRMGKGITIEGGSNGKYALRGAIVEAAFQPQGFTLLGFLQKFPTNMQFQGEYLLGFYKQASIVVDGTELLVKKMREWTDEEAKTAQPVNFSALADLRQPGKYQFKKETWNLNDTKRNRQFYVIVYKPTTYREGKTPVVVMSHGLSSRPEDYVDKAEHLASYGYVVVLPQHPGSDLKYLQDMFQGYHKNIFDVNEFIDRPLDISYVIDELERRNEKEFDGKLNLKTVGAFGHSFGGYTVLAIAGAQIDFTNLAKECNKPYGALDTALLLECRALELPRQVYQFRDQRVVAVIAANPVNRGIFGPKGISQIDIPIMLGSGSYDPATPPVFEQIGSFTWLKSTNKYLGLGEGQAHVDFSTMDGGITSTIKSTVDLTLPKPSLLHKYFYAISLAFTEVYIAQNKDFLPYLQSSYAEYLSQGQEFNLYFISGASDSKVVDAIKQFKQQNDLESH